MQGERRQVAVLFADLSGFTGMSESMDPEDLAAFVSALYRELGDIVDRHGGYVDKFMGDAVMALFGAPVAHEDDPERAVRAALAMLSHIETKAAAGHPGLGMRIGVNLGDVVVGNVGPDRRMTYTALGDTVNAASRLEKLAPVNSLLVSAPVFDRVREQVEAEEGSLTQLRGREAPIRTYRIVSCRPGDGRRRLSGGYFGREQEIEIGRGFLRSVAEGRAVALYVNAEAGAGKSRYVTELRRASADLPFRWFQCRSSPLKIEGSSATLRELALGLLELPPHDAVAPEEFRARVRELTAGRQDDAAYLMDLVGLPLPESERAALAATDPKARRDNTWLALWSLVQARLRDGPLTLFFDDVHWLRETGRSGLRFLVARAAELPVAFVFTGRPEAPPAAGQAPSFAQELSDISVETLSLPPLAHEAQSAILRDLLQDLELPAGVRERVLQRSDGNPLFLEELVRSLRQAGMPPDARSFQVPSTLQSLLLSRVDRLPATSRLLLQLASVLGVDFSRELLERLFALEQPGGAATPHLQVLLEGEFLVEGGDGAPGYLRFRHALIQETAYGTLLKRVRAVYHEGAGILAEELFAESLEMHAPVIAHHFWEAESWQKALQYHWLAGRSAAARYALTDARGFFSRALDLLETARAVLPAEEALAVREQLGLTELHLGELANARGAADALLRQAHSARSSPWEARAGDLIGKVAFYRAEYREALRALQQALDVLPEGDGPVAADILNTTGISHFMLGDAQAALKAHERALHVRQCLNDRLGIAKSLLNIGNVYAIYMDDLARARSYFEEALGIGREINDRMVITNNLNNLGKMDLALGRYSSARDCFSQALEIRQAINWRFGVAETLLNLAETDLLTGRLETARAQLETTLSMWQRVGNAAGRFFCLHLLGLVYMKAFADEKARACLEEAVGLAEELGAELELDDLLYSLGRLELAQSRNAQAARLFDRARELAARYNDAARGVLADAFLRRARRENAVHSAGEAPESSLEEVGRRKPLAAALCYLRAREFLGSGHVGRAWETARRGLRWAEEVEDPSLLRHVAAEAARAAHAAGRPSEEVERILDVAHRATWVLLENYPRDVPREPFMEHPYNRALLEAWPDAIRAAPRR